MPSLFNKLIIETTESVLFWNGWNDDSRVIGREGFVEPQEVGIASKDGK